MIHKKANFQNATPVLHLWFFLNQMFYKSSLWQLTQKFVVSIWNFRFEN